MISTIGLFWRRDNIFWGKGSQAGALLGVPADQVTSDPIDFRDQVGIYALYADYEIVYVTMEKEIGSVVFDFADWSVGSDWHLTLYLATNLFFSQNENRYALVWTFEEMQHPENEYITHQADALYFEVGQARPLLEALTEESIESLAAEQQRQAEIEAEFQ